MRKVAHSQCYLNEVSSRMNLVDSALRNIHPLGSWISLSRSWRRQQILFFRVVIKRLETNRKTAPVKTLLVLSSKQEMPSQTCEGFWLPQFSPQKSPHPVSFHPSNGEINFHGQRTPTRIIHPRSKALPFSTDTEHAQEGLRREAEEAPGSLALGLPGASPPTMALRDTRTASEPGCGLPAMLLARRSHF